MSTKNYIRGYVTKCPQSDCKAGYIDGELCETCLGVGRIVIPCPEKKQLNLWIPACVFLGMFLAGVGAVIWLLRGIHF